MKATTYNFAVIGDRMRSARKALGLNQTEFHDKFVGSSRITLRTFQRAETGSNEAGMSLIEAFVRAGINANWLLTGEEPMLLKDLSGPDAALHRAEEARAGYVAIPLYNSVRAAAGSGALVEHERPDDALMFKEAWVRAELGARPGDLYLIRVAGDSMEPTLRSGDAILVDRRATRPDREGVYILRMNDMLLVKRLQALPGGVVRVSSDNPAFAPFDIKADDIGGPDPAIIGRAVWTGRRI